MTDLRACGSPWPEKLRFKPHRPDRTVRDEATGLQLAGGEDLARLDALLGAIEWELNAAEGNGG